MKRLDDAKRQVDAALTSSDEQDKFGLAVSSYFSEAQLLFDRIGAASNQMMARFVFEQTLAQNKQPAFRPFETKPLKKLQFPSMEDVEAANRRQICIWYAKLPTPQTTNSKEAMARIAERYKDFGGCTPAILRENQTRPRSQRVRIKPTSLPTTICVRILTKTIHIAHGRWQSGAPCSSRTFLPAQ